VRRKPSVLRERRDQRDRWAAPPRSWRGLSTGRVILLRRTHPGRKCPPRRRCHSPPHQSGGRWQRVLPGLYATFRGELSAQDRCRAAVLYAGADAQLTGPTALRQFRVRYLPDDDGCVHVLVAHATSRQNRGFVAFTRTTRLPRPWWRDGLPWTPVARAAVDTCRDMRELRAVRALMAEVVQRKLAGVPQLSMSWPPASRPGARCHGGRWRMFIGVAVSHPNASCVTCCAPAVSFRSRGGIRPSSMTTAASAYRTAGGRPSGSPWRSTPASTICTATAGSGRWTARPGSPPPGSW